MQKQKRNTLKLRTENRQSESFVLRSFESSTMQSPPNLIAAAFLKRRRTQTGLNIINSRRGHNADASKCIQVDFTNDAPLVSRRSPPLACDASRASNTRMHTIASASSRADAVRSDQLFAQFAASHRCTSIRDEATRARASLQISPARAKRQRFSGRMLPPPPPPLTLLTPRLVARSL